MNEKKKSDCIDILKLVIKVTSKYLSDSFKTYPVYLDKHCNLYVSQFRLQAAVVSEKAIVFTFPYRKA